MFKTNFKKTFLTHCIALALVLSSLSIIPVNAATTYLSEVSLEVGKLYVWYPTSNTNGWPIVSGTDVTVYIKLGSAETNVVYGLRKSTGGDTRFNSFDGSTSSTTTKTVSSSGDYKVYVQNNTASTITVKNSSYIKF